MARSRPGFDSICVDVNVHKKLFTALAFQQKFVGSFRRFWTKSRVAVCIQQSGIRMLSRHHGRITTFLHTLKNSFSAFQRIAVLATSPALNDGGIEHRVWFQHVVFRGFVEIFQSFQYSFGSMSGIASFTPRPGSYCCRVHVNGRCDLPPINGYVFVFVLFVEHPLDLGQYCLALIWRAFQFTIRPCRNDS